MTRNLVAWILTVFVVTIGTFLIADYSGNVSSLLPIPDPLTGSSIAGDQAAIDFRGNVLVVRYAITRTRRPVQ